MARKPGSLGVGGTGPSAVILGKDGQRVDAVTGDIIQFAKALPSTLANQNIQARDAMKFEARQTAIAKVTFFGKMNNH